MCLFSVLGLHKIAGVSISTYVPPVPTHSSTHQQLLTSETKHMAILAWLVHIATYCVTQAPNGTNSTDDQPMHMQNLMLLLFCTTVWYTSAIRCCVLTDCACPLAGKELTHHILSVSMAESAEEDVVKTSSAGFLLV